MLHLIWVDQQTTTWREHQAMIEGPAQARVNGLYILTVGVSLREAGQPATRVRRSAVLHIQQRGTDSGGHRTHPTVDLVIAAAVPQANTSVISPLVTPSRHWSMETRRSSTVSPRSAASSTIEERVTPCRIVPVSSGVTRVPSR